ncbi:hypothetical protein ACH5RR_022841 [Cinchona calisaya]|uniref:F-box domain-containing protein n=1 Tax=Cinchona calisaya TaxID=153742 RepID=A0ABD2Z903_9GENT
MTQGTFPDLPFEVIVIILLSLPAESLIRCMCVSKAWYALISSGKFIQKHLQVMASRGNQYISCGPRKVCSPGKSFNLLCAQNPNFALKKAIPYKFDSIYCVHVCSSSGLLCLSDVDNFGSLLYLWNPCIRKFKCISSSSIKINHSKRNISFLALGFGYLNKKNEYKIVRISNIEKDDLPDQYYDYGENDYEIIEIESDEDNNGVIEIESDDANSAIIEIEVDDVADDNNEAMEVDDDISDGEVEVANDNSTTEVEVYSLSTDSWKKIEIQSFPWFMCDNFSRAFVNNRVHWMIFCRQINKDESMILSFDLDREMFQQIRLPNYDHASIEYVESVVYKDTLGFVVIHPIERTEFCSLWVMKEYGAANSWSKLFNVEVSGTIYKPLTLTKNDQIMFKGEDNNVCLHNFQNLRIETLKLDSHDVDFLPLVDSLILVEAKENFLEQGRSFYEKADKVLPAKQMSIVRAETQDASTGNELDVKGKYI